MDENTIYTAFLASLNDLNFEERLLDVFGSAKAVYNAPEKLFFDIEGVTAAKINKIKNAKRTFDIDGFEERMKALNARFITRNDVDYPEKLLQIPDAPMGFYIIGDETVLKMPAVAIVGSRKVTSYGVECTEKITSVLSQKGICIVSGMAQGTDSYAHKAAINAGGKTVAVFGTGIDMCYPSMNLNLKRSIIHNGCVISEYPLGTRPEKWNFPFRNRIISGLADVVAVIEADRRSGSMITANHALDQDKTIMALPGNINSALSNGTNLLIRDGAIPITAPIDVLEQMQIYLRQDGDDVREEQNNKIPLENDEKLVYDCMDSEPKSTDELVYMTKLSITDVIRLLSMLELKGYITKASGQKYMRCL